MTDDTQSQAISALNQALATGFETADFEALGRLFAEDSLLLPARGRPITGRAAIIAFWTGVRNRFAGMVFTATQSKLLGSDFARDTGTYVMAAGDSGAGQATGKFLLLWQKVDGSWLLESSIWTRNPDQGQGQGQGQGNRQGGGGQGGQRQGGGRGGPRQGGQGGQGGYRQGGGAQGGYRQAGYGQGEGGARRNRGGIAGQQGGIGGIGAGVGGGGRRGNPQAGRRGPGGQAGQGGRGGVQNSYEENLGLYSNRDD